MVELHIALEEGFEGDAVVVQVDGRQVLRDADVRTRHQIGLATTVDVTADADSTDVTLSLVDRDLSRTVSIDTRRDVWCGWSVTHDGRIEHRVSGAPLRYA